jgi:hypothetical protein
MPESAPPTDDGPTQVSWFPVPRVPEPVATPRKLLEPERRRVDREIHPWPIASGMIARHARSIYYYELKCTYIVEKCTISLACRLHHVTRPWTEPGRVGQDPSPSRFTFLIIERAIIGSLPSFVHCYNVEVLHAGVAELVDAPDSKSGGRKVVWVRVPPPALA